MLMVMDDMAESWKCIGIITERVQKSMMDKLITFIPHATNKIVELCTGQEGSGTKYMMESNATSRDGYTGNWSNEFRPHEKAKHQDPTYDEWNVPDDEYVLVQHYPTMPSTPEPTQEPINTPPTAPEPEEKTIEEPLAVPEPELTPIIEPITIEPKAAPKPDIIVESLALPKPTLKIIDGFQALPKPDPPLPAPTASDTIQDTTEVQDRAHPRSERKTHRPKVKYKEVEYLLATSKGDHQLVTSKGGKVYRGKTAWLKGVLEFSSMSSQPA